MAKPATATITATAGKKSKPSDSYEKNLNTLGDQSKQQTMAGWGYQWQFSDKGNSVGGWVPISDTAKSKYKTNFGEDFTGNMATLALGGKKVVSFAGSAYTGGLESQGYQLQKANSIINSNQSSDFENKENADNPPVRGVPGPGSFEDYMKPYQGILDQFLDNPAPVPPNMVDLFQDKMGEYGIPELEQSVNDLTQQKKDEEALMRERTASEEDKAVSMGVISGRTSEIKRQSYEKLDFIGRQIDYATNQLNTKYAMVNTIMNLTQTDYQNASTEYYNAFNKAMQMITFTRGVVKDYSDEQWRNYTEEQRQKERTEDNARANLSIIYNSITAGNTEWAGMDQATKNQITKLEQEAGLPAGFTEGLHNNNPAQDIISTTSRQESNGDSYADVIMRDHKTGAISVQHIFLGKSKVSGSGGGGGGGNGSGTDVAVGDMTNSQLEADYNLSLDGVKDRIKVSSSDTDAKHDLTREQAADELFKYYQGRKSKASILSDIYETYPDDYRD